MMNGSLLEAAIKTCGTSNYKFTLNDYYEEGIEPSKEQVDVLVKYWGMYFSWGKNSGDEQYISIRSDASETNDTFLVRDMLDGKGITNDVIAIGELNGSDYVIYLSSTGSIFLLAEGGQGIFYDGGESFLDFLKRLFSGNGFKRL